MLLQHFSLPAGITALAVAALACTAAQPQPPPVPLHKNLLAATPGVHLLRGVSD